MRQLLDRKVNRFASNQCLFVIGPVDGDWPNKFASVTSTEATCRKLNLGTRLLKLHAAEGNGF